jgi:hypothetical protein
MKPQILLGVLGMMEKVAVSKLMASHTQIRRGRRPYRVDTLLKRKEREADIPEFLKDVPEKTAAKDYGPGGKWIHDRAHRIMEDSPETPKSVAYATATQQAHKVGKSPKDFRTREGVHEAKMKYDAPKSEYQKTAGVEKQKRFAELIREAMKGGMTFEQASKKLARGGSKALAPSAPKSSALHAFEDAQKVVTGSAKLAGFFDELNKIKTAGVGVDLRMLTKSGVTKIHMPNEESLEQAKQKLERTQRVGADLKVKPPDPNIRAVATKTK